MKLIYHKGKNFGAALNPHIFYRLFPNFFDNDEGKILWGIGSIIGLRQHHSQKKIVFSSGYAAGDPSTDGNIPKIDSSWDIRCVRGPLTAKILNIDKKLAVSDGAILLKTYYNDKSEKKHMYSYMPHHVSFNMYSQWEKLLSDCDVNLIDPRADVETILREINTTEFLISEAMHGAIAADALRVPWLGVKAYPYINDFKWIDWAASLDMNVYLQVLPSVHEDNFLKKVINNKTKSLMPDILLRNATSYVVRKREHSFINKVQELKKLKFSLSSEKLLESRCDQLESIAQKILKDYR